MIANDKPVYDTNTVWTVCWSQLLSVHDLLHQEAESVQALR